MKKIFYFFMLLHLWGGVIKVEAAFLGAQVREQQKCKIGVEVIKVIPGSPAAAAKLAFGDIITNIFDINKTFAFGIFSPKQFSYVLDSCPSGTIIGISVIREGLLLTLYAKVTAKEDSLGYQSQRNRLWTLPSNDEVLAKLESNSKVRSYSFFSPGLRVDVLNNSLASKLGLGKHKKRTKYNVPEIIWLINGQHLYKYTGHRRDVCKLNEKAWEEYIDLSKPRQICTVVPLRGYDPELGDIGYAEIGMYVFPPGINNGICFFPDKETNRLFNWKTKETKKHVFNRVSPNDILEEARLLSNRGNYISSLKKLSLIETHYSMSPQFFQAANEIVNIHLRMAENARISGKFQKAIEILEHIQEECHSSVSVEKIINNIIKVKAELEKSKERKRLAEQRKIKGKIEGARVLLEEGYLDSALKELNDIKMQAHEDALFREVKKELERKIALKNCEEARAMLTKAKQSEQNSYLVKSIREYKKALLLDSECKEAILAIERIRKNPKIHECLKSIEDAKEVYSPKYNNSALLKLANLGRSFGQHCYLEAVQVNQALGQGKSVFSLRDIVLIGNVVNPKQNFVFRNGFFYDFVGIIEGITTYSTADGSMQQALTVNIFFVDVH